MEMESGKLFVGGISWDTNEERLRVYFQAFGEIEEAVVMRDRSTGRSRGFGFVVFGDASVAERVVKEKHVINGRTVEAKKAVPRDDLPAPNRSNNSLLGSPGSARVKKIFVGGLAPTVTESDFKRYFEQFGTIMDLVVMYDHNTQRPRGFGFITYESEEAVDKVLVKSFHELNGKMVEVKRAMPKELSPGPTRSPSIYGTNRLSNFLNAYPSNSPSSYSMGMRMDGQFSPAATVGRNGYPSYSPGNHGLGLNLDSGFGLNHGCPVGGDSGFGYGLRMNSHFEGNSGQYNSPILPNMGSGGNASFLSSLNRNVWENQIHPDYSRNTFNPNNLFTKTAGFIDGFGSVGEIWGQSSVSTKGGIDDPLFSGNLNYGQGAGSIGGRAGYARNNAGTSTPTSSYSFINNVRDGGGIRNNYSMYRDHGWLSSSPEPDGFASLGYGHSNAAAANVMPNNSGRYAARQNPRIVA